ncbi:MAG: PEP-utilizing enzyme [Chitinophagales bacterium]
MFKDFEKNSFSISDKINTLIGECIEYGTIPFSILARHGFIAEGLLRSAVNNGVLDEERLKEFRRSIITVAGAMSDDFSQVLSSEISKEQFLQKYGHLRPSSYDILSPNYANRPDLFDGAAKNQEHKVENFKLTNQERQHLTILLGEHGIDGFSPEDIFKYAEKAIKGREYAKFIFTRHLSFILEYVAEWGELKGFDREEMAMLNIYDIVNIMFAPLTNNVISYYENRIKKARNNFEVASSFKLSYLLRSIRDVYIVPMQRSAPNFIGSQRLEAEVVELTPYQESIPQLENKIICIEGADPGYDWIFTRGIAGLVTKYGGANSHMAIRSAEYNIPAAIGCGEQPYQRIINSKMCLLDCKGKRLEPLDLT